ncbi:Fic family protein [Duganella phyllosphaerae]|uniref:Fic/DOC family protein n=1 Tax=Duganella phyllosphaerae TaxID=762836 RepID=A0A1E7WJT8_9BURK|nr:Fic family protein [Duganella phyllosphaerae]OEZ98791.1 Fic/DOC family protein [Duganella phyllosphaerae]
MILFELMGSEEHPLYQELEMSNGNRQYDFLRSIISAAIKADKIFLSTHVIKALNFQAITCLHTNAGEFRPCAVTVGDYQPPAFYRVQAYMDDFVNEVNSKWRITDPIALAAFVLWRLNYIHPFINGNGRTARAVCYFVLCLSAGGWLPGTTILPELIRREREAYVVALREVDASFHAGAFDLKPLHQLLEMLVQEQLSSAPSESPPPEA